MWTAIRSFADLSARGRWKVEFFQDARPGTSHTAIASAPLGDLVTERRETIDPQLQASRVFSYLGLEHVESHTGDLIDFAPRRGAEVKSRSKVFAPGDVLYGRLRPYLNKAYLAEPPVDQGICSGEFYVLVPGPKVDAGYLRTVLASSLVLSRVGAWQTGAALPRLPLSDLLGISIPLPPLEQQRELGAFAAKIAQRRRRLTVELRRLPELLAQGLAEVLERGELLTPLDLGAHS